ncbi:hypothetical protein HC174_09760 [Salinimicrobium sp. CDJ15-81-2]|nr:hypothetical protein [Salinimicrobium nanhaiense]
MANLCQTNRQLLRLYRTFQQQIAADPEAREELNRRILLRDKIDREMPHLYKKLFTPQEEKFQNLLCTSLTPVSILKYQIYTRFTGVKTRRLRKLEAKNINQYYNLLFDGRLPSSPTNVLLKQKKKIEKESLIPL